MYESISAAVLLMIMTIAWDVLGRPNEYATGNRLRCKTATQRIAFGVLEAVQPTQDNQQHWFEKCKGQET